MNGPDGVLLAALLGAALVSGYRLVVGRPGAEPVGSYLSGPGTDLAHLLMNLGMAVMLTPSHRYSPSTHVALVVLFGALTAAFAAAFGFGLVRPSAVRTAHRPAFGYHVVAAAAMVYATVLMPPGSMNGPRDMAGMAGMSGMDGMPGMHDVGATPAAAWLLGVLFALDALATALVVLWRPDLAERVAVPGDTLTAVRTRRPATGLRMAALPHVVMDVGMAVMLLRA